MSQSISSKCFWETYNLKWFRNVSRICERDSNISCYGTKGTLNIKMGLGQHGNSGQKIEKKSIIIFWKSGSKEHSLLSHNSADIQWFRSCSIFAYVTSVIWPSRFSLAENSLWPYDRNNKMTSEKFSGLFCPVTKRRPLLNFRNTF